jgi:hypothetical protein
MITMTNIAGIHGARTRVESVVQVAVYTTDGSAWKRQALVAPGGFPTDNSTGVSAEECRRR